MAGLIPQGFVDELLARTDIVELIDQRVPLKRTGTNLKACCPFHNEKTPSFTVNADKQFYYCFGCGAAGNAVGFLMEYDNMSFPECIEHLAKQAGLEVPRDETRSRQNFDEHKPLFEVLTKAQQFFAGQLRNHGRAKVAVEYLKDRGLTGVIARDFGVGFAPPGWDNLLKAQGTSTEAVEHLTNSGMLIKKDEGGHYDRFRNRITFPIKDHRGRIIGFGGRIIDPKDNPKYLNSPETPVFNKGAELYGLYEAKIANRRLNQLLVVEGYMDVIALAQMDIRYAVATLGTAIGATHLKRMFKQCEQICFCFDGDDAGRRAAYKALQVTLPEMADEKDVRFLFLPDGHDPDSLVRAEGKTAFEARIRQAQPLSEYLFTSATNGEALDTVDARAKFVKRANKLIDTLPDGTYKQLMLTELEARSGLKTTTVEDSNIAEQPDTYADIPPDYVNDLDYADAEPAEPIDIAPPTPVFDPSLTMAPAYKACLLLFHYPHLINCAEGRQLPEAGTEDLRMLNEIIAVLQANPDLKTGGLYGRWMKRAEEPFIKSLMAAEKLCPDTGAASELSDHLDAVELQHQQQLRAREISRLKHTPVHEMSDEQKQKLRQLLASK